MNRRELLRGACAMVLAVAGRGAATAAAARTHRVEMARMRFGTVPGGIAVGDTILWVNRDVVPHTVTARDRSFDLVLAAGASGRTVVRRAGSLAFYCRYHPAMRGILPVAAR